MVVHPSGSSGSSGIVGGGGNIMPHYQTNFQGNPVQIPQQHPQNQQQMAGVLNPQQQQMSGQHIRSQQQHMMVKIKINIFIFFFKNYCLITIFLDLASFSNETTTTAANISTTFKPSTAIECSNESSTLW